MKPWREVAVPHRDVLSNRFQQSEFAVDISSFRNDDAPLHYRDATEFYTRTYITDGMRRLLIQVAQRLNGDGGDPVVQLQTAFGGGKTHTMLAVYHLTQRDVSLAALPGVSSVLEQAGVMDVPRARVAILDGTARGPNEVVRLGVVEVRTLWGHLAWQLGGLEAFEQVRHADASGTSPGKEVLTALLRAYAPCVVLIDELVAYVRQFVEGQSLSGGTYNSNLSFVQALTESVKQVPNAMLMASLPESEVEAGDSGGVASLVALSKVFGRVEALWKPITAEEGFEIVRRRLFEPVRDEAMRDTVCRAFANAYAKEGARVPPETHKATYYERMVRAYPIHPEVFERLYEDWSTLPKFQRTRGVLTLMAQVIQRLWKDQNSDLMILPGSVPLGDHETRNRLVKYLSGEGWDPVVGRDIDGDGAEAVELDTRETRFGALHAARRVARTIFLGSAPAGGDVKKEGLRGIDRARVILGCLQPDQSSTVYSDALNRLSDRLHYLNASGDRLDDATRYWFDVRANLRREMEDRKGRFDDAKDVQPQIAELVTKLVSVRTLFEAVHVFTPHADVPDDSALRLVVLGGDRRYSKQEAGLVYDIAQEYLQRHGSKPRYRGNRLVFLAADGSAYARLRDAVRTVLAWSSIDRDIRHNVLVVDNAQQRQAEKELEAARLLAQRAARDCYRWVVAATMDAQTSREPTFEAFSLNTSATSFATELERVCAENEVVVAAWSPVHLRDRLRALYWKDGRTSARAVDVWEDVQKYLYLPRLKDRSVFEATVRKGATGTDFFGTAFGERDGHYEGFRFGDGDVQFDATLVLIDPEAARAFEAEQQRAKAAAAAAAEGRDHTAPLPRRPEGVQPTRGASMAAAVARSTTFDGSVDVSAATAKMKLVEVADEVIAVLSSDPHAEVRVTVEIHVEFPQGALDNIKRAVTENAAHLGFKVKEWG